MFDYHIHPGYSIDAEPCSITDYCSRAVATGLTEICFTPHLEVDPVRRHLDWFVRDKGRVLPMEDLKWLDSYFKDIEAARLEWGGQGLTVQAGLEVGYDLGLEKTIERVVSGYPFDFVLGSVHCLEHLAISSLRDSKLYFPGKELGQVVQEYFNTLEEAVNSELFDCIGHVDLYRRYGCLYFSEEVLQAHEGIAAPLFKKIAEKGMGLEINTSSLRRGHNDFHPTGAMTEMAIRSGVRIFTVGSDAHRLDELGCGVEAALKKLSDLGIKPATYHLRQLVRSEEKGGQKSSLTIK